MQLGKYNNLTITRRTDNGLYLRDAEDNEVLLPNAYVPEQFEFEDEIEVFVYLDSEERPVATTLKPLATVGDFAYMQVKEVSEYGAFLEWGILKDLFVPFREQGDPLDPGEFYIVYVYIDEATDRIAASCRLNRFFQETPITVREGEEVSLLVGHDTDLGYNVVVNNLHRGLVYHDDVYKKISPGDRIPGFIKRVRPDGKIDVTIRKTGLDRVTGSARVIMEKLEAAGGFLSLHDKSDPTKIREELEMSKKTFKNAIGGLYKRNLIRIEKDGIRLGGGEKTAEKELTNPKFGKKNKNFRKT